jgi:prepilin-type N-terminal cleavage/methylation domain-containing protein
LRKARFTVGWEGVVFKVKKRKGLTLVEVLISLVVLAVAIVSLLQIPALYTKLMAMSIEKENATLLANQTLDMMETLNFEDTIIDSAGNSSTTTKTEDLKNKLVDSLDYPANYSLGLNIIDSDDLAVVQVTISVPSGIGKEDVVLERVVSPFAK